MSILIYLNHAFILRNQAPFTPPSSEAFAPKEQTPEAFTPKKQTPETLTLSITSFNVPTDNNTSFTDSGGFGGGFLKDMQSHAKKIFEISVKRAISLCALW